jgi:hypothetical protein
MEALLVRIVLKGTFAMKRITAATAVLEPPVPVGFRRQETTPQDKELATILSDIHARYSGSLSKFFDALEKAEAEPRKGKNVQKLKITAKK